MRRWLGVGVVLAAGGPAGAFYFPDWPADGLPRSPTLLGPGVERWAPPFETGPGRRGASLPGESGQWAATQAVPEPATLLLAAVGVGSVAALRRAAGVSRPTLPG